MDAEDQYFSLENRLASFRGAQPVPKGRPSAAASRAPKAFAWPHKTLSPSALAKAGFFFEPHPKSPDNVVCFLCHKSLDGWEESDNPVEEHLKHSPTCGWAIMAAIEAGYGNYGKVHPLDPAMIEARKATFAGRWPYESKKGFKCKTKKLVEGGWKYTPSIEADDMTTCAYCNLGLEGWESDDNPFDEHYRREPGCAFFALVNQQPAPKKGRAKAGRTSKASRLSVQSVATVATAASDLASLADITADHDDSVMTTASTMTQGGKKTTKGRKASTAKGRKTKAKKDEAVEILEDEPHVQEPAAPRGRKRASDAMEDVAAVEEEAPAPKKKRATRVGAKADVDNSTIADTEMVDAAPAKQPAAKKKRASTAKTARKTSQASVQSQISEAALPDDDELDRQLEADLERYHSDAQEMEVELPLVPAKGRARKAATTRKPSAQRQQALSESYAMFDPTPVIPDEAEIEAEFETLQAEMQPAADTLMVKKGRKTAGTRKASKQTKKAKEPAPPSEPDSASLPAQEPEQHPEEADLESMDDPDASTGTVVTKTVRRFSLEKKPRAISTPPRKTLPYYPPSASRLPQPPSTPRAGAAAQPTTTNPRPRSVLQPSAVITPNRLLAVAATPSPTKATPFRHKRTNTISHLQSTLPWHPADLDLVFSSPARSSVVDGGEEDKENAVGRVLRKGGMLSTQEKAMTVEEWIYYNAGLAEQRLRDECERMVGAFEREGERARGVLEGLVVE
ncbi:hypothetical protein C8A05DRAFT_30198 [Staphylotrichum tortipilum]|uniref:BIR-domain-containing protein n=1 Tax=Staphylotrichum tortipilum TaxID=2831512 RepID=A0AAN6RXN5_9PEZI|nr:hypothetical protein C8A05DRAFT_30198 [Staphylotrichum longicolle]